MTALDPPSRGGAAAASRLGRIAGALRGKDRAPVLALIVCVLVAISAVFGDSIAPYAKDAPDYAAALTPPFWLEGGSLAHLLGTDQLGRDTFSRLVEGARISLMTAGAAIVVAGTVGTMLGLVAGYFQGWIDIVISRLVDAFLALPFILMALAFVAAFGAGTSNIILVMILTNWARYTRLVRSEVIGMKHAEFVTLACVAGVPSLLIILRHILPNTLNSIVVLALLDVGRSIILEASLSFLGLGIQPPDVSWGLMLADGRAYMSFAWWTTTFPGLAIVATVMSFNALGDWLKARLDPRSRL